MRRVIALLVLTVAISQAQPASAQARGVEELPMTIQIRDYAHVPAQSIARASRIVSDLYARIGVRIEWLGVVSPGDRRGGSDNRDEGSRGQIRQMTILLVTPTMAARGHVGENVLGFVAVANEGMGRIAYVVFDRLRDTARHATTSVEDVLGFVMAHEIAHLLLPIDAQAKAGLMKDRWTVDDFRQLDVRQLGFSELETNLIRNTIANDPPTLASRATGWNAGDQCIALPPGEREVARRVVNEGESPRRRDRHTGWVDRTRDRTWLDCPRPADPSSSSDSDPR